MTIKKQRNNINPNIKPWMGFLGVPFEVCVCVCGGGGGGGGHKYSPSPLLSKTYKNYSINFKFGT